MSVQFGQWNFDGMPLTRSQLEDVNNLLVPYGQDGEHSYYSGGVAILYHAFHTTEESHHETQPYVTEGGAIIVWDGRLDNRKELIPRFKESLTSEGPDVAIVAAAYMEWGTKCFARLIGDWALSIWNPDEQTLILAKDPIGTRHLYYSLGDDHVEWSTILDPLVLYKERALSLCEEYIAGWFSLFPAPHLTPYIGIHSVPPSSFVHIRAGNHAVSKYWDFDPAKKIRYGKDAEYEEHFRSVFGESVRRRLSCDTPILAELSGGMDSSSVVCMADRIIGSEITHSLRLDTVSYYDDSEPNWNERPYFNAVEDRRGRSGRHIDFGSQDSFYLEGQPTLSATALPVGEYPNEARKEFARYVTLHGYRVVLSGIGGDEITGGVPTPAPEIADLLARVQVKMLAHQLKVWALNKRKPWFQLLIEAIRGFLPPNLAGVPKHLRPPPWLQPGFVKRHWSALTGYGARIKVFGGLPSLQENVAALCALQRQLACDPLPSTPHYERRYPYLDRDLVEFMYAVPREQIVRPGQRRSLMRRALTGIVPDIVLNRKRKAFVSRGPRAAISNELANLTESSGNMACASLGIVDQRIFWESLQKARCGQEVQIIALMRTLFIECWLRGLKNHGLFVDASAKRSESVPPLI